MLTLVRFTDVLTPLTSIIKDKALEIFKRLPSVMGLLHRAHWMIDVVIEI